MRTLLILAVLAVVAGCATPHPGVVQSPEAVQVPPGKAKVILTRADVYMFMGVPARVDMNGQRVVELWRGESYAAAIEPGKVVLSTDAWSTPGRYIGTFTAEPGREYVFEIAPRSEHNTTLMWGGLGAAVAQASMRENTGPFSIQLKASRPIDHRP